MFEVVRPSGTRYAAWWAGVLAASSFVALEGDGWAATVTTTYASTGEEQTFTVPAGVTRLHVVAVGARGGAGGAGLPGGAGATVTADVSVVPGETLFVEVGGNGTTNGAGGFNGGGAAGNAAETGGSGGGASDIRTVARSERVSLGSRLIVAGGGGGGGANGGGVGGAADASGGASSNTNIVPGGAGTLHAGGAGGAGAYGGGNGAAGTFGQGGAGGSGIAGGGGGGGYFGGGGAGGGGAGTGVWGAATGSGGGGGASYIQPGATGTVAIDVNAAPSILLSYETAAITAAPASVAFAGTQPTGTTSASIVVTLTNGGTAPLTIAGLSFAGTDPDDFIVGATTCYGVVAPTASCTVAVRFVPQAAGARAASLEIASNAPNDATIGIALSGTAGALPQGPQGDAGAGGAGGSPGPAGADGADGAQGADGADGGCATSPAKGASPPFAVGTALLGLAALRRRRRKQP